MRLKLYYPGPNFSINQAFGESNVCVPNTPDVPAQWRKPVRLKTNGVCPVGFVELYPLLGMKGHTGLDLYARRGVVLRSPIDGVVEEVQGEPERGLGVGIVTHEKVGFDDGSEHYAKVRQWHLMSIWVHRGQKVKIGDPIGQANSTGISSGDHNHFELKPVEYRKNGVLYNVKQNNGYFGSVDPQPYFTGQYALNVALGPIQRALEALRGAVLASLSPGHR